MITHEKILALLVMKDERIIELERELVMRETLIAELQKQLARHQQPTKAAEAPEG